MTTCCNSLSVGSTSLYNVYVYIYYIFIYTYTHIYIYCILVNYSAVMQGDQVVEEVLEKEVDDEVTL